MKKISAAVTGILFLLTSFIVSAQDIAPTRTVAIQPLHLAITFLKTTNLVFPYAIKSVDRGSRDILVQKAIGVENVLQVKAAKQVFPQTNLTVITADGNLYSFTLDYSDTPSTFNLVLNSNPVTPKQIAVFEKDATTADIQKTAAIISGKERTVNGIKDMDFSVLLDVKGIYIHDDMLYFQLLLQNNSNINYKVQSLRFVINDKKQVKRTTSQEVDLQPAYVYGQGSEIHNNSEQVITIAIPKFTIPDQKYLSVQLREQDGGRHLSVKIKNKHIIHARII